MNSQMLSKFAQWLDLVQRGSDGGREAISTQIEICDRAIQAIHKYRCAANELESKFTEDGNFRLEYPMFLDAILELEGLLGEESFDEFNQAVSPPDSLAPRESIDALESIRSRIEAFASHLPDDIGILRSLSRDDPSGAPRRNFNMTVPGISNRHADLPSFSAGGEELEGIVDDLVKTVARLDDYFATADDVAKGMRGILGASLCELDGDV